MKKRRWLLKGESPSSTGLIQANDAAKLFVILLYFFELFVEIDRLQNLPKLIDGNVACLWLVNIEPYVPQKQYVSRNAAFSSLVGLQNFIQGITNDIAVFFCLGHQIKCMSPSEYNAERKGGIKW